MVGKVNIIQIQFQMLTFPYFSNINVMHIKIFSKIFSIRNCIIKDVICILKDNSTNNNE